MSDRKNDKIVYVRKDNRVACKLTLKEAAALDKAAQAAGHSRSCFIRNAIRIQSGMRPLKRPPAGSKWGPRKLRKVFDK